MKGQIISAYTAIFIGADTHDWQKVRYAFAEEVKFDYSSLSGVTPGTMKREEIVKVWSMFLPGFDQTMHFLANHEVTLNINKNEARATCYGHALHLIHNASNGPIWEVFGFYNFDLSFNGRDWRVTSIMYQHKYASGNQQLPQLAGERIKTFK